MRIISYSVDQFDSQFAQRLSKSARALKLDCDLYRWSRETMPPASAETPIKAPVFFSVMSM